jgi:hypothetical protein
MCGDPVENVTRRCHCHEKRSKQVCLKLPLKHKVVNCSEFIAKIEEWPAFKRISNVANNFDVTPKTNLIRVPTQKHHSNDWRPKQTCVLTRDRGSSAEWKPETEEKH